MFFYKSEKNKFLKVFLNLRINVFNIYGLFSFYYLCYATELAFQFSSVLSPSESKHSRPFQSLWVVFSESP